MTDYALRLESIGDDRRDKLWHWRKGRVRMGAGEVAGAKALRGRKPFGKEVLRLEANGTLAKREIEGHKSYLDAKGTGGRGVFFHYTLAAGRCYQVRRQISWKRDEIEFIFVTTHGAIERISEAEARLFARQNPASC